MIKTVIFDIDGTMYDFKAGNQAGINALKSYCQQNLGLEENQFIRVMKEAGKTAVERTGRGTAAVHNRLIRYQCMLELLDKQPFPHALAMCHVYWHRLFEHMKPYPGLSGFMEMLKGQGIRIGIGSNMTAYVQYRKLERLGVEMLPDWIVTSEEAGVEKPAPGFFKLCIHKSGCKPDECLFIGDSLEGDVEGALASGMKALLYGCEPETGKTTGARTSGRQYGRVGSYYECMDPGFMERFGDI